MYKRLTLIIAMLLTSAAYAESYLVMFTSDHCGFCQAWERDIGENWPETNASKSLTLIRQDLYKPLPEQLSFLKPAKVTPTFVIIKDGKEVNRILGYNGPDIWWWNIEGYY